MNEFDPEPVFFYRIQDKDVFGFKISLISNHNSYFVVFYGKHFEVVKAGSVLKVMYPNATFQKKGTGFFWIVEPFYFDPENNMKRFGLARPSKGLQSHSSPC